MLRAWDLHDNLDSRGAILFRRFASRALGAVPVAGTPGLYTTQFDFADPVHTPYGLNIANPVVEQSFADAVTDLRNAGIPLDAPLRDWQYERRGSEKIPIHGGPGTVGVFNAINVSWTGSGPNAGYSNVPHGSSYVMVAQFTGDENCPVDTRNILTYSQSTNPNSPYFADQTRMFSNKQWVDEAYCESEIAADPNLNVQEISEASGYPRPKGATPVRVPLVPAFRQCTSPDRTHGPPLAFPSCSGPVPTSGNLTVGTPDQPNGAAANFTGFVRYDVQVGAPGPPDDSDIGITVGLTDVRCAGAGSACGPANARGGSDYTGELQVNATARLTDKWNDTSPGGGTDPATVVDIPFPVPATCIATSSTAIGSSCSITTSAVGVGTRDGAGRRAPGRAAWADPRGRRRARRARVDRGQFALRRAGHIRSVSSRQQTCCNRAMKRQGIAALAALLLLAGCGDSGGDSTAAVATVPPAGAKQVKLAVGDATLLADVADDDAERALGLGGRASLRRDAGMYFVLANDAPRIWMKGMRFPLDLVWIYDDRVVDVTAEVPDEPGTPESQLPIYSPSQAANRVLEVNSGWAARNGVNAGDSVRLQDADAG